MMIHADELVDMFDNYEMIIDAQSPKYPDSLTLNGIEVREFLAYKLLKLESQIKNGG